MRAESAENSFLAGNEVYCPYPDAGVALLQAPYEGTVSYGKGAATGPHAIIRASGQLEIYDIPSRTRPSDIGIATLAPVAVDGGPEEVVSRVHRQVAAVLSDGKKPVLLGGEHSVALGAIRAAHEAHPELGVLQLDAHADLRNSYEGTPFSHACVMRRVLELGIPHVGVGIRSMSEQEARFAEARNLTLVPPGSPHGFGERRPSAASAIEQLPDHIYVTIDVDVLDPSCMPATGTPEPGGPSWDGLMAILGLLTRKEVVGFDVVELAPIPGLTFCEFTAAKLVYKMIGMFWR